MASELEMYFGYSKKSLDLLGYFSKLQKIIGINVRITH